MAAIYENKLCVPIQNCICQCYLHQQLHQMLPNLEGVVLGGTTFKILSSNATCHPTWSLIGLSRHLNLPQQNH